MDIKETAYWIVRIGRALSKKWENRILVYFILRMRYRCRIRSPQITTLVLLWPLNCFFFPFFLQATIGIDFLSKTMYLEDRTVSKIFVVLFYGRQERGSAAVLIARPAGLRSLRSPNFAQVAPSLFRAWEITVFKEKDDTDSLRAAEFGEGDRE